jgi:hypothetical protein
MPTIVSAGGAIVRLSDLVGDPKHDRGTATTIGGTAVQVLSVTVAASKRRNLTKIFLSSSIAGKMAVKLNGSVIDTARLSPANLNIDLNWLPVRPITAGDIITVEYTARSGPPGVDVECVLMSAETDA